MSAAGTEEDLSFEHSARGFLTKVTAPAGTPVHQRFDYDPWGRLTQGSGQGIIATYGIDALGRTISRTAGSASEVGFTYEGLSETLVSEATSTSGTTWANLPSGPWFEKQGGERKTAIRDLHGDLIALSSSDGSSLEGAFWYSPFGEQAEIEPSTPTLGYQGQLTDPATGLVDMTTRQYMPSLGRFTTPDVLFGEVSSPQSLNQYGYALANPVTFADPSGMCVLDEATDECYQSPDTGEDDGGSSEALGSERQFGGAHERWTTGPDYGARYRLRLLHGPVLGEQNLGYVLAAANEFGVDPFLLLTLMIIEGEGRQRCEFCAEEFEKVQVALASNPSIGIMQMQFGTFKEPTLNHLDAFETPGGNFSYGDIDEWRLAFSERLRDEETAIRYAAAHLADIESAVRAKHRSDPAVLAGVYNGGIGQYEQHFVVSGSFVSSADNYVAAMRDPNGLYYQVQVFW